MRYEKLKSAVINNGLQMKEFYAKTGICCATATRKAKKDAFTIKDIQAISKTLDLKPDEIISIFFES